LQKYPEADLSLRRPVFYFQIGEDEAFIPR